MSIVLASILDADWLRLRQEIEQVDAAGIDGFSLDIMDGSFAPRITFGAQNVAMIRNWTDRPIEVHLMIESPEEHVHKFMDAGADQVVFHVEATDEPITLLREIRSRGLLGGVAIEIGTSLDEVSDAVLVEAAAINVMAVPVGYGGAAAGEAVISRVRELRQRCDELGTDTAIEVDGGVKPADTLRFSEAGADLLVIGTGIYHSDSYVDAVAEAHSNLPPNAVSDARLAALMARPAKLEEGDTARRERLDDLRRTLDIPKRSWDPLNSLR